MLSNYHAQHKSMAGTFKFRLLAASERAFSLLIISIHFPVSYNLQHVGEALYLSIFR